jgi:hypothetical protein
MEIPLRAQSIERRQSVGFSGWQNLLKKFVRIAQKLPHWRLGAALQGVSNKQRLALDQGEQDEGGAGWSPAALLPVAEGFDRDAERLGKRALGRADAAGANARF